MKSVSRTILIRICGSIQLIGPVTLVVVLFIKIGKITSFNLHVLVWYNAATGDSEPRQQEIVLLLVIAMQGLASKRANKVFYIIDAPGHEPFTR